MPGRCRAATVGATGRLPRIDGAEPCPRVALSKYRDHKDDVGVTVLEPRDRRSIPAGGTQPPPDRTGMDRYDSVTRVHAST